MSKKESAGFKLIVLGGVGALVVGGFLIKNKLGGDSTPPANSTTAQSAQVRPSATPAASSTTPPKATSADRAALFDAASAGDLAKVQALHAEKNVALNGTLAFAAKSGSVPLLTWLIDHGVDVHEDEDATIPPLLEADDNDGVVSFLLARGAKEVTLVQAVHAQAPKAVARLIAKKADANGKTDGGASALHAAITSGNGAKRTTIVKSLLDGGAKPEVGLDHETPLQAAIHQVETDSDGAIDVMKLIIAKTPVDRDAMMMAMNMHSDKKNTVIDTLLTGKVPPDVAFRGVGLATDPKVVAKIAAKSPIAWNTKDTYVEDPPLIGAARRLDVELVNALLAAGAPADGVDESGDFPLLAAISSAPPDSDDATKVVTALLGKGANPNRRAKDGRRPLHVAASRGQEALVRALLNKGAHVDDEVNGTSPLEEAESNGHQEIAKILVAKGARKKPKAP